MERALELNCSFTGNTEKVAKSIIEGLEEGGMETTLLKFQEAGDVDYLDYDLVCVGAPSYNWSVPQPVNDFLKKKSGKRPRQLRRSSLNKPFPAL